MAAEPYAGRHAIRFGFGLVLMLCIAMVDIRLIAKLAWLGYALGVGLLVLVALHGEVGKGAQRWIDLGFVQLQPSELMKILLVVALAAWFHRASWERIGNPLFLIPPAVAIAIPAALIFKQPNLGNALITLMVGGAVFFAAGVRWWKFAVAVVGVGVAAPIVYENLRDYQRARIMTFLDPESDPLGRGTTSSSPRSRWARAGSGGRGSCRARRAI